MGREENIPCHWVDRAVCAEDKHQLLALKAAGKLNQVRMLAVTTARSSGLGIYTSLLGLMAGCLAIKPTLDLSCGTRRW